MSKVFDFYSENIAKIQNSSIFQVFFDLFSIENGFTTFSKYNENFNIYSYRNKYIEELAKKHLDNNNIFLHTYCNIIYNYS